MRFEASIFGAGVGIRKAVSCGLVNRLVGADGYGAAMSALTQGGAPYRESVREVFSTDFMFKFVIGRSGARVARSRARSFRCKSFGHDRTAGSFAVTYR
jgi:hypothetical protein